MSFSPFTIFKLLFKKISWSILNTHFIYYATECECQIFQVVILYLSFCWLSLRVLCFLVCLTIFGDRFMSLGTSSEEIMESQVKLHSSRENVYWYLPDAWELYPDSAIWNYNFCLQIGTTDSNEWLWITGENLLPLLNIKLRLISLLSFIFCNVGLFYFQFF